jgi:hypothetical protein
MTMAKMSAKNRARLAELKARSRQAHRLQAKRNGKPEIPDGILKKLAALNLPPNPFVYQACLEKLLRGA